jgi:low affinity Fe/Cu permease
MATSNGTEHHRGLNLLLERFTYKVTEWVGSARAFVLALTIVSVWALTGPIYEYSNTWQLIINTGTTIITFLMVFLIQRSQNKESLAVQLKLNEIIAALRGASNRLINVECLSEDEVRALHARYQRLAARFQADTKHPTAPHSIEEDDEEPGAPGGRSPCTQLE